MPTADYGMSVPLNQVTQMVQLFEEDDWREVRESDELRAEWLSDRMLLTARPSTITNPNIALEPGVATSATLRPQFGRGSRSSGTVSLLDRSGVRVLSGRVHGVPGVERTHRVQLRHRTLLGRTCPPRPAPPPAIGLKIAIAAVEQNDVAFTEALQALTLTAVAFADAFIACWDAKYGTDVVRPVTYIREHIDENWVPVIVTPPFPEYTAGHSVQSFAAASTLTGLFGDLEFTDDTHAAPLRIPGARVRLVPRSRPAGVGFPSIRGNPLSEGVAGRRPPGRADRRIGGGATALTPALRPGGAMGRPDTAISQVVDIRVQHGRHLSPALQYGAKRIR